MALTIGSNIASLKAQQQLRKAGQELGSVYERLSSGLRINRASDDPAGLALSQSLKSDARVFNQGVRNLNDGISLLNIADSAISELSNIVSRLKELAEQAANGTYSYTQRTALDNEAQALSKEYLRIAKSTVFNGKSLFAASTGQISLQAGYGANGSISSNLGGVIGTGTLASTTSVSGSVSSAAFGDINGDGYVDSLISGGLGVGVRLGTAGGGFGAVITYNTDLTSTTAINLGDLNGDGNLDLITSGTSAGAVYISTRLGDGNGGFGAVVSHNSGAVTASNLVIEDLNNDGFDDVVINFGVTVVAKLSQGSGTLGSSVTIATGLDDIYDLKLGDIDEDGYLDLLVAGYSSTGALLQYEGNGNGTFTLAKTYYADNYVYAIQLGDINNDSHLDIVTVNDNWAASMLGLGNGTFNGGSTMNVLAGNGEFGLGDLNGDGILDLVINSTLDSISLGNGSGTFTTTSTFILATGNIYLADINGDGVQDSIGTNGASGFTVAFTSTTTGVGPLLPFNLKSISDSRDALNIFENKLEQLALQRGTIGAFQSRAEVAVSNLQSMSDNYSIAASRITDADIADETAKMIRLQILQQAEVAVLAQANLQPSLVLKLITGGD